MEKKTFEDLKAFIEAQPPDRQLAMKEIRSPSNCGCLLVHFGQAQGLNDFQCGFTTIQSYLNYVVLIQFDRRVGNMIDALADKPYNFPTYKEVQDWLKRN